MADDDRDIELLAASLRADTEDIDVFVEAIASKLEGALPQRTKVIRQRVKFLIGPKKIQRIVVDFGDSNYTLLYNGKEVEGRVAKASRGITLKSEALPLDAWIDSLARAIEAEAQESERGRQALQRLLGVGP